MTDPQLSGPSYGPVSGGEPKQLVVFLHGRGANGQGPDRPRAVHGAAPAPTPCFWPPTHRTRWIWHRSACQWFSLLERTPETIEAGVRSAAPAVNDFLDHHLARHGLTDGDLALFGFSQGCMMALHVGLRRQTAPAAVLGYSGLLAAPDALADELTVKPPVLLVHGEADEIVPHTALPAAETALKGAGVPVEAGLPAGPRAWHRRRRHRTCGGDAHTGVRLARRCDGIVATLCY